MAKVQFEDQKTITERRGEICPDIAEVLVVSI